jgi:hypothetical protein
MSALEEMSSVARAPYSAQSAEYDAQRGGKRNAGRQPVPARLTSQWGSWRPASLKADSHSLAPCAKPKRVADAELARRTVRLSNS